MFTSGNLLPVLVFVAGLVTVVLTLFSALSTFVLPRSARSQLNRIVFGVWRRFFETVLHLVKTYERRDAIMAYYAPISVISLLPVWYLLVWLGYAAMYWALGVGDAFEALRLSGSSLFTLGFAISKTPPVTIIVFTEAMAGLMLVGLLIAYLPTMYAAFSRREQVVNMLEVRAGSPPSAAEMLLRFHRNQGLDKLADYWKIWEAWFADIEETHTSLAALTFFRSPQPEHSWVTAAGAILDAAALASSTLDIPRNPKAELCIRAGYLALRRISDFFQISYNAAPTREDPISISREEFDEACARLIEAGIPVKPDRDRAWGDFTGWRVNYDTVLLALARLTMAPYAPWSSDRSLVPRRSLLARRRSPA